MAGLLIQASGTLVEVEILELLKYALCFGICHTSIGLVLMMVKEIDPKVTLGMAA